MKNISSIELKENSNEELLPGYTPEFPYIASCAELDKYATPYVPWHWHKPVELFYLKSGRLEYTTPNKQYIFPAGSGGFVNSNVLHASKILASEENDIQLLHIFDPSFLAGEAGSLMESKYILPLTTASEIEMIALSPDMPSHAHILKALRDSFDIFDQEWGYEFRLRESLTNIWLELLKIASITTEKPHIKHANDEKIKTLMIYIHDHFQEDISIDQLAEAGHLSRRSCFRLFQEKLHMSPVEYIRDYRLQRARRLLLESNNSITDIAHSCGLGSSSYFGKVFRVHFGCTPVQYRKNLAQ